MRDFFCWHVGPAGNAGRRDLIMIAWYRWHPDDLSCLATRQTQFYGGVYMPAANRGAARFPWWFGEPRQGRFFAHLGVSMVSWFRVLSCSEEKNTLFDVRRFFGDLSSSPVWGGNAQSAINNCHSARMTNDLAEFTCYRGSGEIPGSNISAFFFLKKTMEIIKIISC